MRLEILPILFNKQSFPNFKVKKLKPIYIPLEIDNILAQIRYCKKVKFNIIRI